MACLLRAPTRSGLGEAPDFTGLLTGGLLDLASVIARGIVVVTCLSVHGTSSRRKVRTRWRSASPLLSCSALPKARPSYANLSRTGLCPLMREPGSRRGITDPFTEAAIRSAIGVTPRTILMRCDAHRRRCLAEGMVVPCDLLAEGAAPPSGVDPAEPDGFDAKLLATAPETDLNGLLDDRDDGKLGMLLRDTFELYAKQIPPHDDYDVMSKTDPGQKTPPIHGRLTFTDHRANDRERHFCFRALSTATRWRCAHGFARRSPPRAFRPISRIAS